MRSRPVLAAALITGVLCAAIPASGQVRPSSTGSPAATEAAQRLALAADIIKKWSTHIQEVYKIAPDVWASQMAPLFGSASIDRLQQAANATNFDLMTNLLVDVATPSGAGADGGQLAQLLGDTAADLVFVPVTPCRIFDTRVAGGAIPANSTRDFDVTAVSNYSFQGGDSSNCGGTGAAGSFAAAVINFTVVTPSAAGYITAFPYLTTQPLAATVNYNAGDIRGNLAIVKLDQGPSASELSVYTWSQTHLVGDIVGYFITPEATALQCQDTANTIVSVGAGSTTNVTAPACPAGYTQTATNCESASWQMPFVFARGGTCSAQNNGGSAAELRASRTCCRVPGR